MKRPHIRTVLCWILVVILCVLYGPGFLHSTIVLLRWGPRDTLGLSRQQVTVQGVDLPMSVTLSLPASANTRQGLAMCGPYAVSAFIRIATGKTVSGHELRGRVPWQIPGQGTGVQDMEALLLSEGVQQQGFQARALKDEDKIRVLQETLAKKKPIILLVRVHYIVLAGYDREQGVFYVYDPYAPEGEPGMTQDENGDLPGNRTMGYTDVLSTWSQGGFLRSYDWYFITVKDFQKNLGSP